MTNEEACLKCWKYIVGPGGFCPGCGWVYRTPKEEIIALRAEAERLREYDRRGPDPAGLRVTHYRITDKLEPMPKPRKG